MHGDFYVGEPQLMLTSLRIVIYAILRSNQAVGPETSTFAFLTLTIVCNTFDLLTWTMAIKLFVL